MKNDMRTFRIRFVSAFIVLGALIIFSKLYMVQIVHGESYSDQADRQYSRPSSQAFNRGSISFTTKDGERIDAATLKTGYTVTLNPSQLLYPEDAYNGLSFLLDLEEESFMEKANKSEDPYEEIAKRVPPNIARDIKSLDLEGVSLYKNKWRYYPGKSLSAHTIGFMSYRGDDLRGQYGLERYYNDVLERNDQNLYANFFVELFSNIGDTISGKSKEGSIVTTIEPTVQSFVEKELETVIEKWGSDEAGAIVMNPKNGEIYAIALNPTFDLNEFGSVEDATVFRNDLVEGVYEMGSIVKPLTMAIGLDTGAVTAETTYDDKGSVTLNGSTFYNYDKKARGVVDMQTVLNQSLNTGVSFVVQKVGNEKFSEYMKKLIGEETGIDLPNEASPLVSNLDTKRDIEHATASFGQGIAMTPIAITKALAALGNGGFLVEPHLVKSIDYEMGYERDVVPNDPERIFSEKTSEEISRMLVRVVDEALANGDLALPNHSVAAKTGTAQIANSSSGGYYDDQFLHSFFGYFPAYDPEFIVFLYNVHPRGAQYASQTLTDPFMEITKFLINYYNVPPDR